MAVRIGDDFHFGNLSGVFGFNIGISANAASPCQRFKLSQRVLQESFLDETTCFFTSDVSMPSNHPVWCDLDVSKNCQSFTNVEDLEDCSIDVFRVEGGVEQFIFSFHIVLQHLLPVGEGDQVVFSVSGNHVDLPDNSLLLQFNSEALFACDAQVIVVLTEARNLFIPAGAGADAHGHHEQLDEDDSRAAADSAASGMAENNITRLPEVAISVDGIGTPVRWHSVLARSVNFDLSLDADSAAAAAHGASAGTGAYAGRHAQGPSQLAGSQQGEAEGGGESARNVAKTPPGGSAVSSLSMPVEDDMPKVLYPPRTPGTYAVRPGIILNMGTEAGARPPGLPAARPVPAAQGLQQEQQFAGAGRKLSTLIRSGLPVVVPAVPFLRPGVFDAMLAHRSAALDLLEQVLESLGDLSTSQHAAAAAQASVQADVARMESLKGTMQRVEALRQRFADRKSRYALRRQSAVKRRQKLISKRADLVCEYKAASERYRAWGLYLLENAGRTQTLEQRLRLVRVPVMSDILQILPLQAPVSGDKNCLTICGIDLEGKADQGFASDTARVSAALGFVVLLALLLSRYLDVPLKYPLNFLGSHSCCVHPIERRRYFLHAGGESREFARAVHLLNRDIEQLCLSQNVAATPGRMLGNLYRLFHDDLIVSSRTFSNSN